MIARCRPGPGHPRTRAGAAITAAGVGLGLIGPFGSYLNGSCALLVAYWVGCLWLGASLLAAAATWLVPWIMRRGVTAPVALALAAAGAALPAGLLSRIIASGLWPGVVARVPLPEWYCQTLLVLLMLAAGRALLTTREPPAPSCDSRLIASGDPVGSLSRCGNRLRSGAARADDTISRRHLPETVSPAPPTACGLLDRLPPQIGRDILALQMEDHYVRVHTRKGTALVLMPLRQAVQEVGHRPGLTVHRSWWVARDAVTGWRRDGRNIRLVLVGGLDVPVARARLVAAREAGLVG